MDGQPLEASSLRRWFFPNDVPLPGTTQELTALEAPRDSTLSLH
jgi:hypothetical protein